MQITDLNRTGLTKIGEHVWVKISRNRSGYTAFTVEADDMPVEHYLDAQRMLDRALRIASDYEMEKAKVEIAGAERSAKAAAEAAEQARAAQADRERSDREALALASPTSSGASALATDRQIAYILRLLEAGAHREGGFMTGPTTREAIAAMDRRSASSYIDSLTGQY